MNEETVGIMIQQGEWNEKTQDPAYEVRKDYNERRGTYLLNDVGETGQINECSAADGDTRGRGGSFLSLIPLLVIGWVASARPSASIFDYCRCM